MSDSTHEMVDRLTDYVDRLLEARKQDRRLKVKGMTQLVLTVLDKLEKVQRFLPTTRTTDPTN